MRLRQLTRLAKFGHVWVKYGLDQVLFSLPWLKAFQFVLYLNPVNWVKDHSQPKGERLRGALEELGPIFVKFGQILSTRRDLLPHDIADALAKLQDQVQPFSGKQAQAIVEKSLGLPLDAIFSDFNLTPIASASIAQVHKATLLTGESVVVKVLRPNIDKVLKQDIALLYTLAKGVQRYLRVGRRLKPVNVVAEIEQTILDELDLQREAANSSQLRRNFKGSDLLYVPEVYWEYCRQDVLVMEHVSGISPTDIEGLKAHGVNTQRLAERVVEVFYTQAFRDSYFHADMHPGNLLVSVENPQSPTIIAMDFGIMGTLNKEDKHYLAANFLAFFRRDYERVATLHIESGWVPAGTRPDLLVAAIRAVCEPILDRPLKDISLGQTLMRLFQVAKRFKMKVLPQLLLMEKTLLNIEGLGRQLYPELDIWAISKPLLERWMHDQVGVKGFFKRVKEQLPQMSERLPELPDLIYEMLSEGRQQRQHRKIQQQQSVDRDVVDRWVVPGAKRRGFAIGVGAGLLFTAGFVLLNHSQLTSIKEFILHHTFGLGMVGVVLLIWGILWHPHSGD